MSDTVPPVPPATPPSAESNTELSRDERRIRAAQDVLRTAIRDICLAHFGEQVVRADDITVHVTVRVRPSHNWSLEFSPPLKDQIISQFGHFDAARDVFVPGHVFCFRCSSSGCEHSVPLSPLHVFKGYDATGRPEWQEFAQALIDEKDERVDQLYAKPPRLVARFQFGRLLKGRQLAAFGKTSLSYSILGQVVAGYYQLDGNRLAITLQVVEGRTRDGRMSLRLNPISHALDGAFLVAWLSADNSASLFRAIQIAERELARIEELVIAAREARDLDRANDLMGRVPGILRRLVEGIERGDRQSGRRTRHVETRRQDQRPVHKALEDAASASIDSCYYDEKAGTFVVVGNRGRAHAFSDRGRHVTSFSVKPAAVDFRLRTRRWRRVEPGEWADVRKSLSERTSPEREGDAE
jgi:hypothetical protein